MSRLRAVVFDCDGVLADTQACWNRAFETAGHAYGVQLDRGDLDRLQGASVGTAALRITEKLNGTSNEQSAPSIAERVHDELLRAVAASPLYLMPGTEQALGIVEGTPIAVASNAPRTVLRLVLDRLGITSLFDVVLSADDVTKPKPAPDVYRLACDRLGTTPADCAAIEDSAAGISAARSAGLAVLAVGRHHATGEQIAVESLAHPDAQAWLRAHTTRSSR